MVSASSHSPGDGASLSMMEIGRSDSPVDGDDGTLSEMSRKVVVALDDDLNLSESCFCDRRSVDGRESD